MTSPLPKINTAIASLQPYQPGKPIAEVARNLGIDEKDIRKLASNENPRGPSKHILDAISSSAQNLRIYPDAYDFTNTLANHHDVDPECIVLGNGSNDVLDLIARTFLDSSSETIIYEHSFLVYKLAARAAGAKIIETPALNYGYNLDAMVDAINDKTRVIWIDNPNNPTGTFLDYEALKNFMHKVPPSVLVVLDEAYWDYLPDNLRVDSVRWIDEFSNLIITRTFSKIHSLAALRVGYGVGHRNLIEPLNRIRQPFNVNSLGLAAATVALKDTQQIVQERETNIMLSEQLSDGLSALGIAYINSRGNFISAEFEDSDTMHQRLLEKGFIVRPISNYGLTSFLRITIGTEDDIAELLNAISDILNTGTENK